MAHDKNNKSSGTVFRHIRNVFIAGVLVAVPLAITYLVFRWLFDTLDGILQPVIELIVGRRLPGVGLVGLLIIVYLLGVLATNVFGRNVVRAFNAMLSRMPVVQFVYNPAREVVDAVRNLRQSPFKDVVIVEFPKVGMYSLAFVTSKAIDIGGQKKVPVFIPHTPNPMTGFLVFLESKDITDTSLTVDEAMRMVLSGGLLSPQEIALHKGDPDRTHAHPAGS